MKLKQLIESYQKIVWTKSGDKITKEVISDFKVPERQQLVVMKAKDDEQKD